MVRKKSEKATRMIYQAIRELREDLRLLDSVIDQVEGLAEDPPRRIRPRLAPLNRPIHRNGASGL